MSHPFQRLTDVVGYTFRADLYCPGCALIVAAERPLASSVEAQLDLIAVRSGMDRQDERSFDSGDFPKVLFRDQGSRTTAALLAVACCSTWRARDDQATRLLLCRLDERGG